MTRPGGVTPRGLPYPGSANIHAETPKALQDLATAIEQQLSSFPGGLQQRLWTGLLTLDGSSSAVLVFPQFQIHGGIAQLSSHMGGTAKVGFCSMVAYGGKLTVFSVNAGIKASGNE